MAEAVMLAMGGSHTPASDAQRSDQQPLEVLLIVSPTLVPGDTADLSPPGTAHKSQTKIKTTPDFLFTPAFFLLQLWAPKVNTSFQGPFLSHWVQDPPCLLSAPTLGPLVNTSLS